MSFSFAALATESVDLFTAQGNPVGSVELSSPCTSVFHLFSQPHSSQPILVLGSAKSQASLMSLPADGSDAKPQKIVCPIPGVATCFAASPQGEFLAGGNGKGKLWIWDVLTGHLLRSWSGHYRKVTSIAFTGDGCFLVTGGGDAAVHVWCLSDILNDCQSSVSDVSPTMSFSQHSLPVTGLYCGIGKLGARVLSCSKDRTVAVYDLVERRVSHTMLFPSSISQCVMDASERFVYCAALNGIIYRQDLLLVHAHPSHSSNSTASPDSSTPFRSQFVGHSTPVQSISLSVDGCLMVSCAQDGEIRIWDTFSCQCLKTVKSKRSIYRRVEFLPPTHPLKTPPPPLQRLKKFAMTSQDSVSVVVCPRGNPHDGYDEEKPSSLDFLMDVITSTVF